MCPSGWKLTFDSLWKSFNLRFEGVLENLRKHRDLVDQEANTISIVESKVWRNEQLYRIRQARIERDELIETAERLRLADQMRRTVTWLNPSDDQEDVLIKLSRTCDDTTSHWALSEDTVMSWLDKSRDSLVLWLNGRPGSGMSGGIHTSALFPRHCVLTFAKGKSVICSKVIEHIQTKNDVATGYYFCSHQQMSSKVADNVLRTLTVQLLAARVQFAPYVWETFADKGLRPSRKCVGEILEVLIQALPCVRIVIDGLDECSQTDYEDIVGDLLNIRTPTLGTCKILFASRNISPISRLLPNKATLSLDDHVGNVNVTISSFVKSRLAGCSQEFRYEVVEGVKDQIIRKANGKVHTLFMIFADASKECFFGSAWYCQLWKNSILKVICKM